MIRSTVWLVLVIGLLPDDAPAQTKAKPETKPLAASRAAPPNLDRQETGQYIGAFAAMQPSILVRKTGAARPARPAWQRVERNGTVHTADTLVALPGYSAVVHTRKKAGILLRGHVRELSVHPYQDFSAEAAVQLHKSDVFDLDVTLLRGRMYLTNRKTKEGNGTLKVRLRFESKVWDMVLQRDTEVGFDLVKRYTPGVNYRTDEPRATLGMCLFRGELEFKENALQTRNLDPEGKAMSMVWDSLADRVSDPVRLARPPVIWNKLPPNASDDSYSKAMRTVIQRMNAARQDLATLLSGKKTVDVALAESLGRTEVASRLLAIYCLGAIDDVSKLIDVLGDEHIEHQADREAAVSALRLWICRGAAQGKVLFNDRDRLGVLFDKRYKTREAETIYDLLHDFPPDDWSKSETFEALARGLQHRKTAVAELAYYHLRQLAMGTKLPLGFNAAASLEDRERYARRITDMIVRKQLPPGRDKKKE